MNSLVSIIIPIYNYEEDLLTLAINSCLSQTHKNIEVLIMTNGMSDEAFDGIQKFKEMDPCIQIFRCPRKGVSHARNEGILHAKGEYLIFLDADDVLEDQYIEIMMKPDCDICVCSVNKVYSDHNELMKTACAATRISNKDFMSDLLNVQRGVGFSFGKLIKTSFVKDNNIFFKEELSLAEDAEFCLSLNEHNPVIVYVPDGLYNYRIAAGSTVRSYNPQYPIRYKNSFIAMKDRIPKEHYVEFQNFVAYHIFLICVNYAFTESNKMDYKAQKQLLMDVLKEPVYKEAIENSSYDAFSTSRKVTLLFLKLRMYGMIKLISEVRNKTR